MTEQDVIALRDLAEVGSAQFKERINDKYDIGCELVAFSNSHGGRLVIGINDKTGNINALSYKELQETTNMLTSMASENVLPGILIDIENVPVKGGAVVVATIPEGKNKPYHDNKGVIWVKNGTDKRKIFDNAEIAEMMTGCGAFFPDVAAVNDITVDDLDERTLKIYLQNRFTKVLGLKGFVGDKYKKASLDEIANAIAKNHDISQLLRNLHFILPTGRLTVAAVLLFASYTQRWLPVITAKCICYVGNSVGGTQFRDKVDDADMEGNLLHQFDTIMAFYTRNLRTVQTNDEFNSKGELEIPYVSLVEFTVNALVHRSLNWRAPIRIFIFDDRLEIHSPGTLPDGLTVDDIKAGTSMPRNVFLFNNANYLLPYTGVGSGIQRSLEMGLDVQFENNEKSREFLVTIYRHTNLESSQETDKSNQDKAKSNQEAAHSVQRSYGKLTKKQIDLLNFCSVPRTAQEIMDRLRITNQTRNRKKHINPLLEMGMLEMTIPEHPNDKNQKYRKIRSGDNPTLPIAEY